MTQRKSAMCFEQTVIIDGVAATLRFEALPQAAWFSAPREQCPDLDLQSAADIEAAAFRQALNAGRMQQLLLQAHEEFRQLLTVSASESLLKAVINATTTTGNKNNG